MTTVPQPNSAFNNSQKNWVVLIVDDMPDILTITKAALKYHGATVYTALNGAEGLEVLKRVTPDVILLDIRMPAMDGWSMYHEVRTNPDLRHVPIIAVTAFAAASDREEILDAGFDSYLCKPFQIAQLIAEIRNTVAHAAEHRQ